jgi:hypothetical protein
MHLRRIAQLCSANLSLGGSDSFTTHVRSHKYVFPDSQFVGTVNFRLSNSIIPFEFLDISEWVFRLLLGNTENDESTVKDG